MTDPHSRRAGVPPVARATPASLRSLAALAGVILLAGCAAVPHDQPKLKVADAPAMGLTGPEAATIAPEWWTALDDPQLNRIMSDALAGSPTLEQAMARIDLAQSAIRYTKAGLLPQVSAQGSFTEERFSNRSIYPAPLGGSWNSMNNLEADLSWSLDLAGKQKALIGIARTFARGSALDVAAARVSLSGAVAQAYVNLARAEALTKLSVDFVQARQKQLDLTQARVNAKLASELDMAAARTLLAEAQQAQTRAEGQRLMAVYALAALAGRGADYYATIQPATLHFDSALPVPDALPIDLLARRADIASALTHVEMAQGGVKYSRAAFYPDVNIQAFIGTSALGLSHLLTGAAMTGGGGPAIHLPIFEGGALRASYRASVTGVDISIAQYNDAVVKAVKEAADALSTVATNKADLEEQGRVVAGLEQTQRLDQVRLRSGLGTRFDTLSSAQRLLTARQAQTGLAADGLSARVQLVVAMGGGFTPIPDTSAAPKANP
ncbi:efflux transporter outer membrane subunit [Novosphingobium terrae]|uniref:efflux transporter outer membrane subunit n=1 Tax=Novosphingobium terrae TaxID=2726189 RepID=UPI001F131EB4|nr:efflux transporter outer membrane subunit [Novosphingobium terrae]